MISSGNCTYRDNSARHCCGGGIKTYVSALNFSGSNIFRSNSARYGGGINVHNSTLIYTGNSSFRDNTARRSGGGVYADGSTLNFTGDNIFRGNSAYKGSGGGITVYNNSVLNLTGNNNFIRTQPGKVVEESV